MFNKKKHEVIIAGAQLFQQAKGEGPDGRFSGTLNNSLTLWDYSPPYTQALLSTSNCDVHSMFS